MDRRLEKFSERIAAVEKMARDALTKPGLAYSSIEDGAIQAIVQGSLRAIIGAQFDGTNGSVIVNGPIPPTPTAPQILGRKEVARIFWDGHFEADALVPMDFARVEIHASQDPGFDALTADTIVGYYESPRGGAWIASLAPGTWHFRFVARSLAGKTSPASAPTSAVVVAIEKILGGQKTITAAGPGTQKLVLPYVPISGTTHVFWGGLLQPDTLWEFDDTEPHTIWFSDASSEIQNGDTLTARFLYADGQEIHNPPEPLSVPFGATWKYATGLGSGTAPAAPAYDDTSWASGTTPMGYNYPDLGSPTLGHQVNVWQRLHVTTQGGDLVFSSGPTYGEDDTATVYIDGVQVWHLPNISGTDPPVSLTVPCAAGEHVIAVYGADTSVAAAQMRIGFSITEEA